VRLNGNKPQVFKNGTWWPICGNYFWDTGGEVPFCKMLGYDNGSLTEDRGTYSTNAIYIGGCSSNMSNLSECSGAWECPQFDTTGCSSTSIPEYCAAGQNVSFSITCSGGSTISTSTCPVEPTAAPTSSPDGRANGHANGLAYIYPHGYAHGHTNSHTDSSANGRR
jgi:hypothetical protein